MHTAVRYGHAGVLRILISANCDYDAFNHNHDTPLHLACALGKRKLTKLLVEAGTMFFRNNQNETARDIAKRKNLIEILEILDTQPDKLDRKLIRESLRKTNQFLHEHKKNHESSPYGCHFSPDTRSFPKPKLQTLPKEPLKRGEIYYMDLAGNIRKGGIGVSDCNCAPYSNATMVEHCKNLQKYVNKANEKLNKKIYELTSKIEKTERRYHEPLYPLLKVVGDKNKQIHLESWLKKVYPEAGLQSPHSSENVKEIAVDIHCEPRVKMRDSIKVSRNKMMPEYDEEVKNEIKSNASAYKIEDDNNNNDDDSYTDIISGNSNSDNSENPLYDETFMRNFQQQQFAQHSSQHNDSLASPSIKSNQNIEMEMERIAKSLLSNEDELMVSSNPDVIRDHIQASAKRSTKKIKSAIVTKPSDLYVNSFFNSNEYSKSHNNSDIDDEIDSYEIDKLVTKVQQTILNSTSEQLPSSSPAPWPNADRSRNRNPLPMNFTDDDNNLFSQNNLLNKLLKAREQLTHKLQVISTDNLTVNDNHQENSDFNPSSSLV
jgi:Ankyrin repeats (3 copies)